MLVLTRKCSEVIRIGDDVTVKVIRTGANTVKIGIEAPKNVRILRGELTELPRPQVAGLPVTEDDEADFADDSLELDDSCHLHIAENCSDQFPLPYIAC